MLSKLRQTILVLIVGSSCLFYSGQNFATELVLRSGQGFVLVLVRLAPRERVGVFAMSNVDTNQIIRIDTSSFVLAGANAWMALVAVPYGRYFWSEYEVFYGSGAGRTIESVPTFSRSAPKSDSDIFEIVYGVVNYIGDWEMRISTSYQKMRLDRTVDFNKSTLERYVTQYPEHSNIYEIYLSGLGKKAISLDEFAKTAKEQSD